MNDEGKHEMKFVYTCLVLIGGTLLALFMKYQFHLNDETCVLIQRGSWVSVILVLGIVIIIDKLRWR